MHYLYDKLLRNNRGRGVNFFRYVAPNVSSSGSAFSLSGRWFHNILE